MFLLSFQGGQTTHTALKKAIALLFCLILSLCFAAAACAEGGVAISKANFPDANFRKYVSEKFDKDGDAVLSPEEIAAVTEIECNGRQTLIPWLLTATAR